MCNQCLHGFFSRPSFSCLDRRINGFFYRKNLKRIVFFFLIVGHNNFVFRNISNIFGACIFIYSKSFNFDNFPAFLEKHPIYNVPIITYKPIFLRFGNKIWRIYSCQFVFFLCMKTYTVDQRVLKLSSIGSSSFSALCGLLPDNAEIGRRFLRWTMANTIFGHNSSELFPSMMTLRAIFIMVRPMCSETPFSFCEWKTESSKFILFASNHSFIILFRNSIPKLVRNIFLNLDFWNMFWTSL